jgi:hypothetical protein
LRKNNLKELRPISGIPAEIREKNLRNFNHSPNYGDLNGAYTSTLLQFKCEKFKEIKIPSTRLSASLFIPYSINFIKNQRL